MDNLLLFFNNPLPHWTSPARAYILSTSLKKKMGNTMKVLGTEITLLKHNDEDYISITDMLKAKDGDFFISDWLRNRNTVEFLGIWERINNPNFNYGEYALIRNKVGLNNYKISVKEWVEKTNALGIKAAAGRYGGTYAHKDIAFEFGMWISAEFKIYLIKEFQRLKAEENERKSLDWDIKRSLARINYRIHTDAIQRHLIPREISKQLLLDLAKYNSQYPSIELKEFNQSHDRFLIIDNQEVYHFGASLKDLGKKWFAFSKFEKEAFSVLGKLDKRT